MDVEPTQKTLTAKGETFVIRASPKNEKGELVTKAMFKLKWESSSPDVVSVAPNGLVTAHKTGDAKIKVMVGEVSASVPVMVTVPAKLALEPSTVALVGVGKSSTITAKLEDALGRPVDLRPIWLSGNTNVLTVQNGVVTSVGPGSTTLTARLNKLTATASISVKFPTVVSVAVEPAKVEFEKEQDAVRLRVTPLDVDGNPIEGLPIEFASEDEAIATVSPEGLVTRVKSGSAKIMVTAGGQSISVDVVVPK